MGFFRKPGTGALPPGRVSESECSLIGVVEPFGGPEGIFVYPVCFHAGLSSLTQPNGKLKKPERKEISLEKSNVHCNQALPDFNILHLGDHEESYCCLLDWLGFCLVFSKCQALYFSNGYIKMKWYGPCPQETHCLVWCLMAVILSEKM